MKKIKFIEENNKKIKKNKITFFLNSMKYKKTNSFNYVNAHLTIKKHEQINNELKNVKSSSKKFKFNINQIKNISKKKKS